MMTFRLIGLLLAAVLLPGIATAQQELLWQAQSPISATLLPTYGGWQTPFTIQPKTAAPSANDEESRRKAAEAAARLLADAQAQADAAAKAKQERAALQKAEKLAASPDAVGALLDNVKIEGILQGPAGSSVLYQGQWLPLGSQIGTPAVTGPKMFKTFDELQKKDGLAAGFLRDKLAERLNRQPIISVTLVQVNSDTAVFSDGREKYKLQLSQPPL